MEYIAIRCSGSYKYVQKAIRHCMEERLSGPVKLKAEIQPAARENTKLESAWRWESIPQKWGNINIYLLYFDILSLGIFSDYGQIQVIVLKGPSSDAVWLFGVWTLPPEPQIYLYMRFYLKKHLFPPSYYGWINQNWDLHASRQRSKPEPLLADWQCGHTCWHWSFLPDLSRLFKLWQSLDLKKKKK